MINEYEINFRYFIFKQPHVSCSWTFNVKSDIWSWTGTMRDDEWLDRSFKVRNKQLKDAGLFKLKRKSLKYRLPWLYIRTQCQVFSSMILTLCLHMASCQRHCYIVINVQKYLQWPSLILIPQWGTLKNTLHACLYKCYFVMAGISSKHSVNTLRPRKNWRHFPDDIFKCIFVNENI